MKKFRLYYDTEKELKWLDQMCQEGWALVGFNMGVYDFEKCEPGEYVYQEDLLPNFGRIPNDYKSLMEDIGAELVVHWGRWVILRKKAADGTFQLYTDYASKLQHYKNKRNMFKVAAIIEIIAYLIELFVVVSNPDLMIGYIGMLICGVFSIATVRAALKENKKMQELVQQQTGEQKGKIKQRVFAYLLPIGLVINVLPQFLRDKIESDFLVGFLEGVAVGMMLIGVYFSMRVMMEQSVEEKK